jgi:Holliday junction resolvase RusA-like endonuclease
MTDSVPHTEILEMAALPPTLNDIIATARRHHFASASQKKFWTNAVALACANMMRFDGEVHLEFVWFVKNRRRDPDNITAAQKYILDGLVKVGILTDDNFGVVKSPVIHWFELSSTDGFALAIRNEKAWQSRREQGIAEPFQYQLSGSAAQPKIAVSCRRAKAKLTSSKKPRRTKSR